MAQIMNVCLPTRVVFTTTHHQNDSRSKTLLQKNLKCNGKFFCLFSNNGRQDQAKKALESALGGKKNEFEKWDKEIKKREEVAGGGNAGGGGWFGWGGWFGGSGDHFWQEAQQAGLAVLGILVMYLIIAKGDVLLAVVFNPLLFALRGPRNGFTYVKSQILQKISPTNHADFDNISKNEVYKQASAKETVVRKWGSD